LSKDDCAPEQKVSQKGVFTCTIFQVFEKSKNRRTLIHQKQRGMERDKAHTPKSASAETEVVQRQGLLICILPVAWRGNTEAQAVVAWIQA
jgi:hypothetical protein